MSRKSALDWVVVGLRLLRDEGQQSLTVDRLARELSLTKGSFYHHFGSLPNYYEALLLHWELTHTQKPMDEAYAQQDPARRARRLREAVSKLDLKLDLAVRAWGLRDSMAAQFLERVDVRRRDCLSELHRSQGRKHCDQLAFIEYALFVGQQQLAHLHPGTHWTTLFRKTMEALSDAD